MLLRVFLLSPSPSERLPFFPFLTFSHASLRKSRNQQHPLSCQRARRSKITLAVTAVAAPSVAWGARWPESSTSSSSDYYVMDIPGLVSSYGTGTTQGNGSSQPSTSYSRSLAITSYAPPSQYTSSPTQLAPQQQLHSPFGFNGYHSGPNRLVSTLHNPYPQTRSHPQQYSPQTPISSNSMSSNPPNYLRNPHQLPHSQSRYDSLQSPTGYMGKPESQTPYMSSGTSLSWGHHSGQASPYSPNQISMYQPVHSQTQASPISATGSVSDNSPKFGTDIDTLMQAIQSKPAAKEAEVKAQQKGVSRPPSKSHEEKSTVRCTPIHLTPYLSSLGEDWMLE